MPDSRLNHALESGVVALPDAGTIAVLNPPESFAPTALDPARLKLEQGFFPAHAALARRGFDVAPEISGTFAAAVVFLPRARDQARALVARAVQLTGGGLVMVDGQKTDGIAGMLKALKGRVSLGGSFSKAHGKLAWFTGGDLSDWRAVERQVAGGFVTLPGVFSADAPDRGSQALAAALPETLAGRGADLGAGWGFLARAILAHPGVTHLDLIEADHTALACARRNITDPRAAFHWADASQWGQGAGLDFVITNPPFHTSRAGAPELGRAFIRAAAGMLAPRGQLWLVANRHLPYEATLAEHFRQVSETPGLPGFKLLHAQAPRPRARNLR